MAQSTHYYRQQLSVSIQQHCQALRKHQLHCLYYCYHLAQKQCQVLHRHRFQHYCLLKLEQYQVPSKKKKEKKEKKRKAKLFSNIQK